jgi:hypothetical protein
VRTARWVALRLVATLTVIAEVARAQSVASASIGVTRGVDAIDESVLVPSLAPVKSDTTSGSAGPVRRVVGRLPIWSAPLASLVVPGVGQARLGQGRAVAYFAVEGFLLLQYGKDVREGHRNARDYRQIARTIARRNFADSPPDTIWQYYEKLSEYVESGAFTMATSGATAPELDTTTYNGKQWLIARNQFGVPPDPSERGSLRYQRALELYESRAVRQPYRWSWRNAQLEKDLYTRTISRTNDAYRRATLDLSAVIANHLLSAIDAFAAVRLSPAPGGAMRVSTTITLP